MTIQTVQKIAISKDGATISYVEYSSSTTTTKTKDNLHNPGLIILHGGLESHLSHHELAETLSSTTALTIYLPDRRGRGPSSPPGPTFSMQTEIDDVEALLLATGAHFIAGISSGAIITLCASLALSPLRSSVPQPSSPSKSSMPPPYQETLIRKIMIFEPPLLLDDFSKFAQQRKLFLQELDEGSTGAALVTALKMTEMAPWPMRVIPKPLLAPLANWAVSRQENRGVAAAAGSKAPSGDSTPRSESENGANPYSIAKLVPTLRYDFQLVVEMQGSRLWEEVGRLEEMDVEVLLMGASRSPAYLRRTMEELRRKVPKARYVMLEGLDHLGLGNRETGGKPEMVAAEFASFLM